MEFRNVPRAWSPQVRRLLVFHLCVLILFLPPVVPHRASTKLGPTCKLQGGEQVSLGHLLLICLALIGPCYCHSQCILVYPDLASCHCQCILVYLYTNVYLCTGTLLLPYCQYLYWNDCHYGPLLMSILSPRLLIPLPTCTIAWRAVQKSILRRCR